jgi:GTP cyclohydrolase I
MSYNKTKTSPELGLKVHEYLVKMGVETPTKPNSLDRKEKIDKIELHFAYIMETLGLDLTDDSLIETPKRVAKMYVMKSFGDLITKHSLNAQQLTTRCNTTKWL